ncbi:hypothetical protein BAUCODRAFT_23627 [Baudoinia panamericana UAMH 10762]|uniref:Myb-like domain-containing protein n=1 Tax=Baudoinia panamericana (strain UAMH 10762) TaxID=717646 RepID=M2LS59_BAUPA|nr:uncharacterized protein BAUCODRAFT_23627 [Baudoinia panamericana UAMH 10762]EMC97307.1 hypothetical protein BAUCODRAFT_23627 [Baudoinia panamericana UAMH 10762]
MLGTQSSRVATEGANYNTPTTNASLTPAISQPVFGQETCALERSGNAEPVLGVTLRSPLPPLTPVSVDASVAPDSRSASCTAADKCLARPMHGTSAGASKAPRSRRHVLDPDSPDRFGISLADDTGVCGYPPSCIRTDPDDSDSNELPLVRRSWRRRRLFRQRPAAPEGGLDCHVPGLASPDRSGSSPADHKRVCGSVPSCVPAEDNDDDDVDEPPLVPNFWKRRRLLHCRSAAPEGRTSHASDTGSARTGQASDTPSMPPSSIPGTSSVLDRHITPSQAEADDESVHWSPLGGGDVGTLPPLLPTALPGLYSSSPVRSVLKPSAKLVTRKCKATSTDHSDSSPTAGDNRTQRQARAPCRVRCPAVRASYRKGSDRVRGATKSTNRFRRVRRPVESVTVTRRAQPVHRIAEPKLTTAETNSCIAGPTVDGSQAVIAAELVRGAARHPPPSTVTSSSQLTRPPRHGHSNYTLAENNLLVELKSRGLSWHEIQKSFPKRTIAALTVHFCSRLKRHMC